MKNLEGDLKFLLSKLFPSLNCGAGCGFPGVISSLRVSEFELCEATFGRTELHSIWGLGIQKADLIFGCLCLHHSAMAAPRAPSASLMALG